MGGGQYVGGGGHGGSIHCCRGGQVGVGVHGEEGGHGGFMHGIGVEHGGVGEGHGGEGGQGASTQGGGVEHGIC